MKIQTLYLGGLKMTNECLAHKQESVENIQIVQAKSIKTTVPTTSNNMAEKEDKADQYLEHVKKSKGKATFYSYNSGLRKFLDWYGKSGTEIYEERKLHVQSGNPEDLGYFGYKIQEFYQDLLNKGFTRNSARVTTNGISGFFRYYGLTVELGNEVSRKILTTKDYVPTIEEYRRMYQIADLRGKVILSMALNLGWRIGDFCKITALIMPNLDQECPIEFDLITEKEQVLSKGFLSYETVELLKAYIPTLERANPYLFQSNSEHHLEEQSINDILKVLAAKAKLQFPEGKRLRFHCFRKRFLSTCANLKVDVNIAKILVGKTVSIDMMAYLSEVDLKTAFNEISKTLSLANGSHRRDTEVKNEEIASLKTELRDLKIFIKGLQQLYGEELFKKAQETQFLPKDMMGKPVNPIDLIMKLGLKLVEDEEQQQKDEYQAIIENGNGNGNGHD